MAFSQRLSAILALTTALALSQTALATAGWDAFIQQQMDVKSDGWQRVGSLLSPTQSKQLTNFDNDLIQLDNAVSQATNSGQLTAAQASEFRVLLGKLQYKQTSLVSAGVMRFPDAEGLLLDLNTLQAKLKAALAGEKKVSESDYFDSKDVYAFRDHLLRKLFYWRTNGSLSTEEYDELKSHVDHLSEKLSSGSAKDAHNSKLLARCRDLEVKMNKVIHGAGASGNPEAHMVNGTP